MNFEVGPKTISVAMICGHLSPRRRYRVITHIHHRSCFCRWRWLRTNNLHYDFDMIGSEAPSNLVIAHQSSTMLARLLLCVCVRERERPCWSCVKQTAEQMLILNWVWHVAGHPGLVWPRPLAFLKKRKSQGPQRKGCCNPEKARPSTQGSWL